MGIGTNRITYGDGPLPSSFMFLGSSFFVPFLIATGQSLAFGTFRYFNGSSTTGTSINRVGIGAEEAKSMIQGV